MNVICWIVIVFSVSSLPQVEGFDYVLVQRGLEILKQLFSIIAEIRKYIGTDDGKISISWERVAEVFVEKLRTTTIMNATPSCPTDVASGVYPLKPAHSTIHPFMAYCEAKGWIVIHRRFNGRLSFDRQWHEYREGFGDLQDEFWLGLKKMHQLTRSGSYELMVILERFDGVVKWSKFEDFRVGSEFQQYQLHIGKFTEGNAGDRITSHNGMKFSTPDRDNDTGDRNCAKYYKSGWWYSYCFVTNLNGLYETTESTRMLWDSENQGLKGAQMLIRAKNY